MVVSAVSSGLSKFGSMDRRKSHGLSLCCNLRNGTPVIRFGMLMFVAFLAMIMNGNSAPIPMDSVSQQYFDRELAKMKLKLHTAAQKNPTVQRLKRDNDGADESVKSHDSYVTDIRPVQRIPVSHPTELQPFQMDGQWHLAVVNYHDYLTISFDTETIIMKWDDKKHEFKTIQSLSTYGATDFLFVEFGAHKYAVIMNHVRRTWYLSQTFSLYYRIYEYIAGWTQPFRISGQVPTIAGKRIVHYIEGNSLYFVTANSGFTNAPIVSSYLYQWRYAGAEIKQVFPSVAADDVETFVIERERFLVFAIKQDARHLTDVYSTVYKKVVGSTEPYIVVQHLMTHAANDVEYFSFNGHHYIAIANEYTQLFTQVGLLSKVVQEYETDSVIYWWSGSLFVEWQRIPSNGAVSWHYFTSNNNDPFLVLCNSKSSPVIYNYDNQHGIFKPTFVQGLNPMPGNSSISVNQDVRSVRSFKSNGKVYLTVANYNEEYREGWNLFELTFAETSVTKLPISTENIIRNAVKTVANKTKQLVEKTKQLLDEVRQLMTKTGNQTVTGKIIWNNVVVNGNTSATNLHWNETIDNNAVRDNAYKSNELKRALHEQAKRIADIKSLWQKTVFLARDANITGMKTFTKDVNFHSDIDTNNVALSGLLNGYNITHANQKLLRTTGDQTISAIYKLNNDVTFIDNLDINGTLNGVNIDDDVITLEGNQTIIGKNTFEDAVHVKGNITLEHGIINDIIPSKDLVQRSTAWQEIEGEKTFINNVTMLGSSSSVNGLIDGVDLDVYNKTAWKLIHPMKVNGKKTFQNGFKIEEKLFVKGKVDNVNVTLLNETTFKRDEDQFIKGFKTFTRGMNISGNVTTESTANGVHLKNNVMTTNTRQTIPSNKTFSRINVEGDMVAASLVDGLAIPSDIALKFKSEVITGKKTFGNNLHSKGNINVSGKVDGVKISYWANRSVRLSKDERIEGKKTLQKGITVEENAVIKGYFNGINLTHMVDDTVTLSGQQTIKAASNFDDVKFNNLIVNGTINRVNPRRDFISLNQNETVSGKMTFLNRVFYKSNINQVNNMNLNGRTFLEFEKDLVKKSKPQTINGYKQFNSIKILKNLTVTGKVNNIRIPDDLVNVHKKQRITGPLIFTGGLNISGVLQAQTIITKGNVNEIDVAKLDSEAVRVTEKMVTVKGKKTFKMPTRFNSATADGKINDLNITLLANSLVSLSREQTITGNKIFQNETKFRRDMKTNFDINNINVTQLFDEAVTINGKQKITGKKIFIQNLRILKSLKKAKPNNISLPLLERNAMSKTKNQKLFGNYIFDNHLTFNILSVKNKLDGIRLDDILLIDGNQNITGKKVFKKDIYAKNDVEISGKVNNVDISILKAKVVTLNTEQYLNGSYNFAEDVIFNHNITTDYFVNGIDLSELKNDTVLRRNIEKIKGNVSLNGRVSFKSLAHFIGALNGINVTKTLNDVVLKSTEQVICAKKIFHHKKGVLVRKRASSKDLLVDGLIDVVNITHLNNMALLKINAQSITGSYVFANDVNVKSNVETISLINGVNVSSDVVTLSTNQNVRSSKCFNNLIAGKDVNLSGKVDGVDLSEFAKNRITLNSDQTLINSLGFKGKVKVNGDLKLGNNSKINDIKPLKEIVTINETAIITGNKRFTRKVTAKSNLTVDGMINGIDINYINNQTIRKTASQLLNEDATFTQTIDIRGDMKIDGFVNGHRIRSFKNFTEEIDSSSNEQLNAFNDSSQAVCRDINTLFDITGRDTSFHSMNILSEFSIPELGKINSVYARGEVFITVARRQGSGCGKAYLLRCSTSSLSCSISHTFITTAISMELYLLKGGLFIFVGNKNQGINSSCINYPEIYKVNPLTVKVELYSTIILGNSKERTGTTIVTKSEKADIQSLTDSSIILNAQIYLPGQLTDTREFIAVKQFMIGKQSYVAAAHKLAQFDTVHIYKVTQDFSSYVIHQSILSGVVYHVITTTIFEDHFIGIAGQELGGQPQIRFYKYEADKEIFVSTSLLNFKAESIEVKQIGSVVWLFAAHSRSGIVICKWKGVVGFGDCFLKPITKAQDVHVIVDNLKSKTIVIGTGVEGLVVMEMKLYGHPKPYEQSKCN